MNNKRIGIMGLGLVGKAIAKRFIATGYSVIGFDVCQQALVEASLLGVDVSMSPKELASDCSTIFLSLPNSNDVEEVLWGDSGIANACKPGSTILDTTTAAPWETILHHQKLLHKDVRFIDIPLIGSSEDIGNGQGVAIIGSKELDEDRLQMVKTFASKIFFFNCPGEANQVKLIVNLVLGLHRIVISEGLGLAKKCNLNLESVLEVIKSSAASSRVIEAQGTKMINGNFERPTARLAQHSKDVGLILDMASRVEARVPLSKFHKELLSEAIQSDWGQLDNAAVVNLFIPPQK